ncbi:unnamed protein product [Rhizoctonia solani]|uniref:DUF6535 domain-containing protein n=1 Tax=Rhizoctonia solani TaxID=456999 RepID=A0A8H3B5T5_9AGAM|nr:unnamed protein product [Rhizoctonia solani]
MSLFMTILNSSNSRTRPKSDKRNIMFACDYPASNEEVVNIEKAFNTHIEDEAGQVGANELITEPQINDTLPRGFRPTPVVQVDPIEVLEPDENGAELGKEARVWKVYVKETSQWDEELIEGWNKSLDVILVFAALFSAISTAFLIESSKLLKEDPTDVSAAALLSISRTLIAIAKNSSVDTPASDAEPSAATIFVPSQHAILINALWYLSLSLSVATSLLAMLAKDWCRSFLANRTGHPWDQALRRQRKWMMMEFWRMQELITILPSLIYLSLLLFAIGLCIYVWDINSTVALPIVLVYGLSIAFYLGSSILGATLDFFPYPTTLSPALRWLLCLSIKIIKKQTGPTDELIPRWVDKWWSGSLLRSWIDTFLSFFQPYKNQDNVTSLALKWLIQNCETPASIAIALQAIAGASSRIPKEPLESCQATLHILRRIVISGTDADTRVNTKLYTRALTVLKSHTESAQDARNLHNGGDAEVSIWELKAENERQVVNLINSTKFSPTDENIQALNVGSSAASLSLRLLRRQDQDAPTTFLDIMHRLFSQVQSSDDLDPAALQSLSNAAVMIASCSQTSPLSSNIITKYINHCALLLPTPDRILPLRSPPPEGILGAEMVFLICLLLHSRPGSPLAVDDRNSTVGARVERALQVLMDEKLRSPRSHLAFLRVGFIEVLFHPEKYDISGVVDEIDALQRGVCTTCYDPWILLSIRPSVDIEPEIVHSDVLAALARVYGLAGSSSIPIPTYYCLVWSACRTRSRADHDLGEKLLSSAAFPKLNDSLMPSLDHILPQLYRIYTEADPQKSRQPFLPNPWKATINLVKERQKIYTSSRTRAERRSRYVASSQLWLLLSQVGDQSTTQEKRLMGVLEGCNKNKTGGQSINDIVVKLEEELISGYKGGYYQGVYSARIVECILERRRITEGDQIEAIKSNLNGVPDCLRGLKSFSNTATMSKSNGEPTNMRLLPSVSPGKRLMKTSLPIQQHHHLQHAQLQLNQVQQSAYNPAAMPMW